MKTDEMAPQKTAPPPPKSLAQTIIARRKALGLTQEALAAAIGVKRSTLACYETHNQWPSAPVLLALRKVLQVRLDDFFVSCVNENE